ncbi:MAG: hypothetical protein R2737_07565 [Candidatus Nanopelagicales bacterium]
MDRHAELRAAGGLIGEAAAGTVGIVRDVHRAVSDRVEAALPAVAQPVTAAQGAVTHLVYAGVEAAHRWAPVLGAEIWARTSDAEAPPPSHSPSGRFVVPAVNGLWGDRIEERHPALSVPMAVRVDHHDTPLDPDGVAAAFPTATPRLVVFLHGLSESDSSWWLGSGPDRSLPSYGDRLADDLGTTAVYVRYNTGRRISANGRSLALLLDDLVAAWPVPVERIDLVGHSMGGLVIRSAGHYGDVHDAAWVPRLGTVVTLGTPHGGSHVEKAAHVADRLLSRLPESAPLARLLGARSVGIKDLRYGRIVDEDWLHDEAEAFLTDTSTDVALLDHVTYYYVAAAVTRDPQHPAGRLVGDGLVRHPSARGAATTRRVALEFHDGAHLGGVGHLSLLNHDDVYPHLLRWLTADSGSVAS